MVVLKKININNNFLIYRGVFEMKKYFALFLVVFCSFFFSGCFRSFDEDDSQEKEIKEIIKPISYGNGVYRFECTVDDFGYYLSDFLKDSSKKFLAFSGCSYGIGGDICFYVVVEEANKDSYNALNKPDSLHKKTKNNKEKYMKIKEVYPH
jgi:hypothetical protein